MRRANDKYIIDIFVSGWIPISMGMMFGWLEYYVLAVTEQKLFLVVIKKFHI